MLLGFSSLQSGRGERGGHGAAAADLPGGEQGSSSSGSGSGPNQSAGSNAAVLSWSSLLL